MDEFLFMTSKAILKVHMNLYCEYRYGRTEEWDVEKAMLEYKDMAYDDKTSNKALESPANEIASVSNSHLSSSALSS